MNAQLAHQPGHIEFSYLYSCLSNHHSLPVAMGLPQPGDNGSHLHRYCRSPTTSSSAPVGSSEFLHQRVALVVRALVEGGRELAFVDGAFALGVVSKPNDHFSDSGTSDTTYFDSLLFYRASGPPSIASPN